MGGTVMQKIVFDGVTCRMSGMGGNQEFKEGEEFEAAKAEAAVCSEMYFIENGYDLTVKGIAKIVDTDVYVLEAVKGKSTVIYYFDTKTFLCLRTSTTAETPQGTVQQITDFSDYRPANGVLFPYTNVQKIPAMGIEMTTKITDIQINTGLSADDFK
jgi:outer membrane lipoprotein-sorting protein